MMKHLLLVASITSSLSLGCGAKQASVQQKDARVVATEMTAPSIDYRRHASDRLSLLQREMLRISARLEREGTGGERTRWQQELSDIEHDRALLAMQLSHTEETPQQDWLATHGLLAELIDALYEVGARTALQIDLEMAAERRSGARSP